MVARNGELGLSDHKMISGRFYLFVKQLKMYSP